MPHQLAATASGLDSGGTPGIRAYLADTRRVQASLTAYLVYAVITGALYLPIPVHTANESSIARHPEVSPTTILSFRDAVIVVGIVVLIIWQGFMVAGIWLRWRWVNYQRMAWGALSAVGLLSSLRVLTGVTDSQTSSIWIALLNNIGVLVYFGIAVWMFVLWRRYQTAWAQAPTSG